MNLNHLNILLADDDPDDCLFFEHALQELSESTHLTIVHDGEELMGYLTNITAVGTVARAENVWAENVLPLPDGTQQFAPLPDVLFLDINMPRKNGLECLSEIKHNEMLKNLAVVTFSTSNSWETINMLFKSGSNVYIHRPSDFSQLKQVIDHALPIAAENKFSNCKVKYVLNA